MTTNELERAVLAAARCYSGDDTPAGRRMAGKELEEAVARLDAWEAQQAPGEREIGWQELAEGDELKSRKNGRFYPVTKVLKVRGGYEITLAGITNKIKRPTKEEPSAIVRRGATGDAVDTLVHVFSSGGG